VAPKQCQVKRTSPTPAPYPFVATVRYFEWNPVFCKETDSPSLERPFKESDLMLHSKKTLVLIGLTLLTMSSLGASFWGLFENQAQTAGSNSVPLSTTDRLQETVWWPTKGAASRNDYVGTEECAKCHSEKATSQASTAMAQASSRPADSDFLHGEVRFNFRQSPYSYKVERSGDTILYLVKDEQSSHSQLLIFAFGKGVVGQTYIYQTNGNIFESRLSFYAALNALDLTTGHPHSVPPDLEKATGRLLNVDEARRCFGCHTTASTTSNHFDPGRSITGVNCEACHGPGAKHVSAMKAGRIEEGKKAVLNPRKLDPVASVDFCGACHRAWGDVIQMGVTGLANVRFQPYRLEESRCWGRGNALLTCVACHNPHEPLVHDADSYDRTCLRCHATSASEDLKNKRRGATCRVSTRHCETCHMPKVEIPDMHHAFTDHRIRIVRTGERYPN
jgi:hypothetical protein